MTSSHSPMNEREPLDQSDALDVSFQVETPSESATVQQVLSRASNVPIRTKDANNEVTLPLRWKEEETPTLPFGVQRRGKGFHVTDHPRLRHSMNRIPYHEPVAIVNGDNATSKHGEADTASNGSTAATLATVGDADVKTGTERAIKYSAEVEAQIALFEHRRALIREARARNPTTRRERRRKSRTLSALSRLDLNGQQGKAQGPHGDSMDIDDGNADDMAGAAASVDRLGMGPRQRAIRKARVAAAMRKLFERKRNDAEQQARIDKVGNQKESLVTTHSASASASASALVKADEQLA